MFDFSFNKNVETWKTFNFVEESKKKVENLCKILSLFKMMVKMMMMYIIKLLVELFISSIIQVKTFCLCYVMKIT